MFVQVQREKLLAREALFESEMQTSSSNRGATKRRSTVSYGFEKR